MATKDDIEKVAKARDVLAFIGAIAELLIDGGDSVDQTALLVQISNLARCTEQSLEAVECGDVGQART